MIRQPETYQMSSGFKREKLLQIFISTQATPALSEWKAHECDHDVFNIN